MSLLIIWDNACAISKSFQLTKTSNTIWNTLNCHAEKLCLDLYLLQHYLPSNKWKYKFWSYRCSTRTNSKGLTYIWQSGFSYGIEVLNGRKFWPLAPPTPKPFIWIHYLNTSSKVCFFLEWSFSKSVARNENIEMIFHSETLEGGLFIEVK